MSRLPIATLIAKLRALFRIPTDNPDLMQSQLRVFTKQVPLLYFILIVNTTALATTHYGLAPNILTITLPAFLTIACGLRLWMWRKTRHQVVSDAEAGRRLKTTVVLGSVLGATFVTWSLLLYRYGDAYAQGHVAFYIGITVISCIFCLMHLRPVALLLTGIVIVPFAIFFLSTGKPAFIAIAVNLLLVSAAMIYILLTYSRDFANMINFQKELVEEHLETQRLSNENSRLANIDSLTDLPNRRQFFTILHNLLHRAAADKKRIVVGLIDLDGFKPVNDVYGHLTGDKILVETGRRLRQISSETIFFARLGGDEFGIILDADLGDADIHAFGERVCATLEVPFTLLHVVAQVSGSAGFATFPEAGTSAEQLYERADYALCHAKQHRRGRPVIFSREHEMEIRQFSIVEQCLRQADFDAEMSLNFQPIFDLDRDKTVAFEALARWNNPELGSVPPDVFVRVAERSDLINRLTQTLLRKALVCAKSWPSDIRISFNLSMRDLASSEAMLNIITIIQNSGLCPSRIDLEVTETALMRDFDQTNASLQALKALGVHISLDDFGTGYSSLSYVHRLSLDKIKIDRSFIKDIETKAACRAIVKTVIDLCRNLKLTCVIEGVETSEQARILSALGCTVMQGYFFGKPMPVGEVMDFLSFDEPPQSRKLA
jgi:diguanylate cyclase (GGDEF)-like protein